MLLVHSSSGVPQQILDESPAIFLILDHKGSCEMEMASTIVPMSRLVVAVSNSSNLRVSKIAQLDLVQTWRIQPQSPESPAIILVFTLSVMCLYVVATIIWLGGLDGNLLFAIQTCCWYHQPLFLGKYMVNRRMITHFVIDRVRGRWKRQVDYNCSNYWFGCCGVHFVRFKGLQIQPNPLQARRIDTQSGISTNRIMCSLSVIGSSFVDIWKGLGKLGGEIDLMSVVSWIH